MANGALDTAWLDGAPVTLLGVSSAGSFDTYWLDGVPVTLLDGLTDQTVTPSQIVATSSVYVPASVQILGTPIPLIESTSTMVAPTVSPGEVVVAAPTVSGSSSVLQPTVTPGGVVATVPLLVGIGSMLEPSFLATYDLDVATIVGQAGVLPPTLVLGNVSRELPRVTGGSLLLAPSCIPGGVLREVELVAGVGTILGLDVVPWNLIDVACIPSVSTILELGYVQGPGFSIAGQVPPFRRSRTVSQQVVHTPKVTVSPPNYHRTVQPTPVKRGGTRVPTTPRSGYRRGR